MRLAVDAFNLAADRRGMGRIVRQVLQSLQRLGVTPELIYKTAREGMTPAHLKREQFDAVWYPWNGMRFAPHAYAIVTINDPFAFTFPHRNLVARVREQAPIRRAARTADRFLAISRWGADELQRILHVPAERITVAVPSIERFWKPVQAQPRAPYVLFVAGPDARKNAPLLFSAYEAAYASGGPELIVVGALSAQDEAAFEKMRAPRRRAHPSDEELRELYSGALAVAVPSIAEGFGLPVLEAMACGAPVLAADATALPEAAGGAALLLAPGDARAWRDALVEIAREPELRESLRERGFARVRLIDPDGYAKTLLASVPQSPADAR